MFQWVGDNVDFVVIVFNQIMFGYVVVFKCVINDCIGEVSFCFILVYYYYWDMVIFFQYCQ